MARRCDATLPIREEDRPFSLFVRDDASDGEVFPIGVDGCAAKEEVSLLVPGFRLGLVSPKVGDLIVRPRHGLLQCSRLRSVLRLTIY